MIKKKIAVLGSTGSIGINALEVTRSFKDHIEVVGLAAGQNIEFLEQQIKEFNPPFVAVRDKESAKILQNKLGIEIFSGLEGIGKIATLKEAEVVVIGISGSEALDVLLKAVRCSKQIALANKEALVMAGKIIMREVQAHNAKIIPVDSEQSAIFQCLENQNRKFVNKLYVTSSGGPLANMPIDDFSKVSPEEAIKHPRWKMGKKISVDSATFMNKALEVIEAQRLFDIDAQKIEVVVHKEAIVHSMVEFIDGTVIAQLGITDMKLPILYAISYPERWNASNSSLDFKGLGSLHFAAPDFNKFPALKLAYKALEGGGTLPCVLNAANEEAVEAFLNRTITFEKIVGIVAEVMDAHGVIAHPTLEQIYQADSWARERAKSIIK